MGEVEKLTSKHFRKKNLRCKAAYSARERLAQRRANNTVGEKTRHLLKGGRERKSGTCKI